MNIEHKYTNKELRFSVGRRLGSGKFYISIPVSNRKVDYEEYYEISKEIYEQCPGNIDELKDLAETCKKHELDENLLMHPGFDRCVG